MNEITIRFELIMPWWTNLYCKLIWFKIMLGFNVDTVAASLFIARHAKCKVTT